MASQLGPIDVMCDAPSYPVVRACRRVGVHRPEDVRWCRISHFLAQTAGWVGLLNPLTWSKLFGHGQAADAKTCNCGEKLPVLERVTFTFSTGREEAYLLGQCPRCGTVYWEET
jgi:hypothetical protein